MSIRVTRDQIPGLIPNNPSVTSITASCSESLDAIMKDSRLPNVENSSNLESKIVDLEAIIISKNRKIDKLDIQKQDLTLSIAEMGKNYAALQNDNQMWKQQCKSLVDARVKFENGEVNVLRVAYADKLKESSELNLELTTCQNQLETIKQILQKTAKSRNFLWDEKQSLEEKLCEANQNFERAVQLSQNLNNKCKAFEQADKSSERETLKTNVETLSIEISSLKQQNEALQSTLNSKDNCIRVWMDSCSKLNQEKKKLLQELIFCKLQIEKEPIPSNKDESVQTDEPLTSKNDVENAFVLKGIKKRIFIALKKIVNSPSPPHNLPLSFDHLSPLRQYGSLYLPAHLWYDLMVCDTSICNPESFYIRLVGRQALMASFLSHFNQCCFDSENNNRLLPLRTTSPGTPCIARRSGYYRGLVIDCERGLVAVHFVDYGDQYSLAVKDVFEIADEFVTQPAFALHSGLKAKIIDNDYPRSIYSPEELTIFRKMIENTKFVATLIDDKGGICRWKIYDQATKKCLAHSLLEAYSKAKRKPANKSTQCDTRILSSNEQNCRLICTPKSQSDTQYGFKRRPKKVKFRSDCVDPLPREGRGRQVARRSRSNNHRRWDKF